MRTAPYVGGQQHLRILTSAMVATIAVLESHYPKRDALVTRRLGISIAQDTVLILALVLPRLVLLPALAVSVQACATSLLSNLCLDIQPATGIAIPGQQTLKIFKLIRP